MGNKSPFGERAQRVHPSPSASLNISSQAAPAHLCLFPALLHPESEICSVRTRARDRGCLVYTLVFIP